ncbi:Peptidoglycan/LPS O-acetylase OafA/YrhL, contains acyltransferase and SGNH-hydrolase domains [Chitinophaga sp. CF118]|uniref:acyltransferase family protein n=1 Tax=Chitinophaga sp. CF118 TaxID=1884367 RepID=UPI0008EE2B15|nr:acyltransferase [Chitinophaga sp. CF118]SFE02884.1 Peptidoglycan/LPS O-acetylase OafA/YrhL, contains acyltransferase and SGNH-hydrolase domains [Chitinophaga sp. CF118]
MTVRKYIPGFDFIRPIAAFSVVWIHGCAGSYWTRELNPLNNYAVPVFIAISLFLFATQVISKGQTDFGEMVVTRFKRLMIPFFIWTLIYLGIRLFKSKFIHEPFEIDWVQTFVFKGSSYQLWYLPNLFYLLLLFFGFLRMAGKHRGIANIVLSVMIIAVAVVLLYTPADIRTAPWFTRHIMLYFLPSLISSGIGMLYYINYNSIEKSYGNTARIIMPILCVVAFVAQWLIPHVLTGLIFVAILFPFLLFQANIQYPFMKQLSKNSMGIYLIHGVFLEGIKTAMQIVHHPIKGLALTLGSIIITYVLSFIVSDLLSRREVLRKYLMGN